ncbi:hypothetical protein Q670_08215 [Alcanivorax sp. P2S70]|uniref:Csu type fimbrial protein n=1 Tax=Alcanivorax sp. P2S70 TaxID=1397527 RepID=UPI0003B72000|nr:spore coat U domain-containing protein [Alcanivorax sp. P2S70]ERP93024.1 hypothetical protein Q670_08215 [Alcanivorax sp. P2S70]
MKTRRVVVAGIVMMFSPGLKAAVECSVQGSPVMDFGTVDPFTGGPVSTQVTVNWSCTRGFFESTQNTLCLHVNNDDTGGMLPRYLVPLSSQPPSLPFNVFDAANHSTVVGQPGGATNTGVGVNVSMPFFTFSASGTATFYGLIATPLPGNTRAELHRALMAGSQARVRINGFNQSCSAGAGAVTDTYTLTAQVNIPDQCQVSSTDLDFGTQNTPLAQADSTSTITVRCSNATDFEVGLNNGASGNRTMTNGSYQVSYELYQDSGRTQRWGTASGEQQSGTGLGPGTGLSFTVFGRVFDDAGAEPGSYSDTVTVVVTF